MPTHAPTRIDILCEGCRQAEQAHPDVKLVLFSDCEGPRPDWIENELSEAERRMGHNLDSFVDGHGRGMMAVVYGPKLSVKAVYDDFSAAAEVLPAEWRRVKAKGTETASSRPRNRDFALWTTFVLQTAQCSGRAHVTEKDGARLLNLNPFAASRMAAETLAGTGAADRAVQWSEPDGLRGWAQRFGCSENAMSGYFQSGQIHAKKIGRRWMVDLREVPTG